MFCMLIHINYNKNKTNWVYLQQNGNETQKIKGVFD